MTKPDTGGRGEGRTKLSSRQLQALLALKDGPRGAYPGISLGTLNALALRGLVEADRSAPGAFFTPHVSIRWSITDAGRAALQAQGDER